MKKDEDCKAYFIRHTDVLAISNRFLLEQIFMKNKILIHFPGRDDYGNPGQEDLKSLDPAGNPDCICDDCKFSIISSDDIPPNVKNPAIPPRI